MQHAAVESEARVEVAGLDDVVGPDRSGQRGQDWRPRSAGLVVARPGSGALRSPTRVGEHRVPGHAALASYRAPSASANRRSRVTGPSKRSVEATPQATLTPYGPTWSAQEGRRERLADGDPSRAAPRQNSSPPIRPATAPGTRPQAEDSARHRHQCTVARIVAVAVVGLLEPVDVSHHRGDRPAAGLGRQRAIESSSTSRRLPRAVSGSWYASRWTNRRCSTWASPAETMLAKACAKEVVVVVGGPGADRVTKELAPYPAAGEAVPAPRCPHPSSRARSAESALGSSTRTRHGLASSTISSSNGKSAT